MQAKLNTVAITSWIFGILVFTIGMLNLLLVHPVPGIVFLLLSFLFFPPVNDWFKQNFGFFIPFVLRVILGILVIWFTLGVSDLGDMIDKWGR